MKQLDEYVRNLNRCKGIEVGHYHRWVIEKIAQQPYVSLAEPKLESGNYLPVIEFEAILSCTACGKAIWYSHREPINVVNANCEVMS